jgi:hypothetical protein
MSQQLKEILCEIQEGLILLQGYNPEKCHANQTQNSHLKHCTSWGLTIPLLDTDM